MLHFILLPFLSVLFFSVLVLAMTSALQLQFCRPRFVHQGRPYVLAQLREFWMRERRPIARMRQIDVDHIE
jgi:hypothetical protein